MDALDVAVPAGTPGLQLDPVSLKALSHPLRVRLLNLLREHGPATATELARRIGGTTSGTTSYHLRQLADHGFIREVPGRPGGRDRRWETVHATTNLNVAALLPDPETRTAMLRLLRETLGMHLEWLSTWLVEAPGYGRDWTDATAFGDRLLHLSPDQLAELSAEIGRTVARYEQAPPGEGAKPVSVLVYAFPRADLIEPPGAGSTADARRGDEGSGTPGVERADDPAGAAGHRDLG
jgi:DNA-binding transcriptional ArsR family regulator